MASLTDLAARAGFAAQSLREAGQNLVQPTLRLGVTGLARSGKTVWTTALVHHLMRGTPMPPTDPLIYRFFELVMINGPAWKALIEEEFGDGIMSAIDFNIEFSREANPKGDRVKIGMSGKFLPYKYYGNQQGTPEYGFKED